MKFIELVQGTQDWKNYRSSRVGASESSILMNISPFTTPHQLWEQKINGKEQESNYSMQRGLDREEEARKWLDSYFNTIFRPRVVEHSKYHWKFASLDAISIDGKIIAEIKWCKKEIHDLAKDHKLPPHYYSQVQSQMACCNVEYMFFLSCYQEKDKPTEFVLVEVYRDEDYIDNMIAKEKEWYTKHIVMMEEPELTDRDYETIENDQFDICCSEYLRICKEIAVLEKEKKVMQTLALAITNDRSSKSGSFKATKCKARSTIDYSIIPELSDVNLELYKKTGKESWRITPL